jgi:hypothetical protein
MAGVVQGNQHGNCIWHLFDTLEMHSPRVTCINFIKIHITIALLVEIYNKHIEMEGSYWAWYFASLIVRLYFVYLLAGFGRLHVSFLDSHDPFIVDPPCDELWYNC